MNHLKSQYKGHLGRTLILAWPVVIGQLGNMLIGLIDSAMIGHIGADYLAAATVANSIFFLVLVLGMGLAAALTPLIAESLGKSDHESCEALFREGLWINFLIGILLALACYFLGALLPFMNQPVVVLEKAIDYLEILSFSMLPLMVFFSYKHLIEGFSVVRPGMYVMLAIVLFNVFFNWVLIYGNLGFPRMELNGAGWATFISRILGMIMMAGYVWNAKRFETYRPYPRIPKFRKTIIKKILSIGIPSSLQYFFEVGAFTGSAIMIGWIGYKQQAAHNIAIALASISYTVVMGFSSAGAIRVANAKGRGDKVATRQAGLSAIAISAIFMSGCALLFVFGRNLFPLIFNDEPDVIAYAASLLVVASLFQISDGIQGVSVGILRGISDVKIPALMTLVAYWVIGLPSGYLFGFVMDMGVVGVWIGLSIGLTFSAIFLSVRFLRMTRNGRTRRVR